MNADPKHTIQRERDYGEFVIRHQYVNPSPKDLSSSYEPALVIARPKRMGIKSAWIIMLGASWKYVDTENDDTYSSYMVEATVRIADMLKLSQDIQSRFKIADAIMENLEDLINMPPWALVADEYSGTGDAGEHLIEVPGGQLH
jgi:hypothetical protein